ncbi:MAG: hypothetical protein ABI175_20630 [Polyangiales bacterium]
MRNEATKTRGTVAVADALGAIVQTELQCVRALWAPRVTVTVAHAFDEKVEWLGEDVEDAAHALAACEKAAAKGVRVAAILSSESLAAARPALRRLVEERRSVVIHVLVSPKGKAASATGYADVQAVTDLGVGVLVARDAQDASDFVIVAHRAAEDAETPILVIHDGYPASYAHDRVVLPDAPLVRAALEPAPPALVSSSDAVLPAHRRAAGRIPFALSSAMRAFERLSGRKLDAIDAHHTGNAEIALVCSGSIAETARAVVEHARGDDGHVPIGLVQVLTLRPFPGAAIVKALSRVRAIAVIDRIDVALAQSNPLATEVKAAFADALTWTPGYPGIGRIPHIFSGSVDPSENEATPGDLYAIIDNLLLGEQGNRVFHVGGAHPHGGALTPGEDKIVHAKDAFTVRTHGAPGLVLHLLADLYDAHVRATPRPAGDGECYDLTVSPTPVRAHHGASALDVVVLSSKPTDADRAAIDRLREGGAAVLLGATREQLPSDVRTALSARGARTLTVSAGGSGDATLLGALLRLRPPPGLDRNALLADAERSLRAATPSLTDPDVRAGLEALGRALEAVVDPG